MNQASSFCVRQAVHSDAEAIAGIFTESILARDSTMILDPVSPAQMEKKLGTLGSRESILVISLRGESIAGWGIVKMYSDRPGYRLTCETSLFISVSARGKGLGYRLQSSLMEEARRLGFHHIIVRIWAANETSISLHRKHGFSMVGIQNEIGHVDSQWIDVAVMQCLLGNRD